MSSPLRRALDPADLAGFGDRIEVVDDLHEWEYGEYEGITTPQIREQNPDWDLWRDGCPGGESPEQIGTRADRLLDRIAQVDGDVLLFAHGHILRVLAARWIALPVSGGARLALKAGAICVLGFERETPVIQKWNA
jgi:probable phosphoglycerate mutase